MKFQFTLVFVLISIVAYSQTMTFNTKDGPKTYTADKSKACNKELVFMIASQSPRFDESSGKLVDKVNARLNFDKKTSGDVSIWFTVNCKGEAFGFQILKGIGEKDKEIVDVLNSLQGWQPAKQSNKSVDCMMTLRLEIKKGKIKMKEL
jgi:hypothetical protein